MARQVLTGTDENLPLLANIATHERRQWRFLRLTLCTPPPFPPENVLDELDAPGEFFYDLSAKKLYLWANGTVGVAPTDVVVPQLTVLINAVGTQALPVEGVEFAGITFRDTAPNFMGPHGTPSGGDWAVGRSGAIFFEGTVGATLKGNLFTSLDGNAVFVSGYARNASIVNNEFLGIGETAISQWGYTDGSPVPGMGESARQIGWGGV